MKPTSIPELLNSHVRLSEELAKMLADDERQKQIEASILSAADFGDKAVTELSAARSIRELIAHRLPTTKEALARLETEIERALRPAVAQFNKAVAATAAVKREEVIATLRPFFESNLRRLDRLVDELHVPAVVQILSQTFSPGYNPDPPLDFQARQARRFLEHSARVRKSLNLPA
jgi:hypothetical protein